MNNPMIILIGLAIAAVGTLVAVNVVLPMLARAEAQAISSEVNTLAGAIWEAERQNLTTTNAVDIAHLLSGWKCDGIACAGTVKSFDSSQRKKGLTLLADGIGVLFKDGANATCQNAASFLRAMNSPFFDVYKEAGTVTAGAISAGTFTNKWAASDAISTLAGCAVTTPTLLIKMK